MHTIALETRVETHTRSTVLVEMRLSSGAARRDERFLNDKEKRKEGSVFVANDVQQIGFQLSLLLSK
jgi:hypothetical protein